MEKNFNTEWLFKSFRTIEKYDVERTIYKQDDTEYFETMPSDLQQMCHKAGMSGLIKDECSYNIRLKIHHRYLTARLRIIFDSTLVWTDRDGNEYFNNDLNQFAVRFDSNKGYPELSTTFDLGKEGVWIHSFTTCHTDTINGGFLDLPSMVVDYFDDFLKLILSERCLMNQIVTMAEKQERDNSVEPLRIYIVNDTPQTWYDNEDY